MVSSFFPPTLQTNDPAGLGCSGFMSLDCRASGAEEVWCELRLEMGLQSSG